MRPFAAVSPTRPTGIVSLRRTSDAVCGVVPRSASRKGKGRATTLLVMVLPGTEAH